MKSEFAWATYPRALVGGHPCGVALGVAEAALGVSLALEVRAPRLVCVMPIDGRNVSEEATLARETLAGESARTKKRGRSHPQTAPLFESRIRLYSGATALIRPTNKQTYVQPTSKHCFQNACDSWPTSGKLSRSFCVYAKAETDQLEPSRGPAPTRMGWPAALPSAPRGTSANIFLKADILGQFEASRRTRLHIYRIIKEDDLGA